MKRGGGGGEPGRTAWWSAGPRVGVAVGDLDAATQGRAYYDRKKAAGKTSMESMRSLKRKLSDVIYRHMVNDAARLMTGPGGHRERPQSPARPDRIPTPALRISHFPDPPRPSLGPSCQPRLDTEVSHERAPCVGVLR